MSWLPSFISNEPVLLVRESSQHRLRFPAAAGCVIYLPDDSRLVELFGAECCVSAVPGEQLPTLQGLLDYIRPALPRLSSSVQRSFKPAAAAADVQVDAQLTAHACSVPISSTLSVLARHKPLQPSVRYWAVEGPSSVQHGRLGGDFDFGKCV